MEALALGIDYIATDLPYILTNAGYAFSRFDMTPLNSMEAGSKDGSPSKKRLRLDGDGSTSSNTDPFYINIRDRKFARDLRPLVSPADAPPDLTTNKI